MPNIHIIGDDLAAPQVPNKRPKTGWGDMLHHFLPDGYTVINHAVNGCSTKFFIEEGLLDQCLKSLQPDDLVLISLGHDDQKKEDPFCYTDPFSSYQNNLRQMVTSMIKHHAKPVMITPITRRAFLVPHTIDQDALGAYPYAMLSLAHTLKIPCIDLFTTSQALFASLGDEASKVYYLHLKPGEHKSYPEGIADDTHLSAEGAELMASLIGLELKKYL
jgi:lysophospholipase L1-like esterase